MINRSQLEEKEKSELQPYACFSKNAAREHEINSHNIRTEFQRDRDRIIHAKAFRRLEYKTQVYLTNRGDHLRTRLTHSLEVSQISRTIALQLGLNTDLVEAIALGHDVGHTPFGHIAERTLNKLLGERGYFKHNVQSVRIFKFLEKKYDHQGLNLTLPVLEGILKHTKFDKSYISEDYSELELNKDFSFTLEGQVVAIADEIAQITHDMDDYLRFNIISIDVFLKDEIFQYLDEFLFKNYGNRLDNIIKPKSACSQEKEIELKKDICIRSLVDFLVTRLIECSEENLNKDLKAYKIDKQYIKFNSELDDKIKKFHKFIDKNMFSDFRIIEMDKRGEQIITTLYNYYHDNPEKLPENVKTEFQSIGSEAIVDFISGMTDRFAIQEYDGIIDLI